MSKEINGNGQNTQLIIENILLDVRRMIELLDNKDIEKASIMIAESDLVIAFGNGGSHAVASHFAGDIMLRPGPMFVTIGDNIVSHTAYANDYSFEESAALAIERTIKANFESRITVIVISTSGESKNVIRAAKTAKALNCNVIAMLGKHLHRLEPYADLIISVDGDKAGRIEVVHDTICHAIAEIVPTLVK